MHLSQKECDSLVTAIKEEVSHDVKISVEKAANMIAQLGGYILKNSKKPGPKVIWRGWEKLQDLTRMYNITMNSS